MSESQIFCGRTFRSNELALMRQVAAECSGLGVTEIARTVCELLEWKRPNGRLKNHECRQLLERLAAEGWLTLPELRKRGGRGRRPPDVSRAGSKPAPLQCAARECEPLAVRVFEGNRSDPTTVVEQIKILREQFGVEELVFVGDRGMVKSKGKQALTAAGLRYTTALTDPEIRRRLSQGTFQLSLFSETVSEVEAEGVRYILRQNPQEAEREHHRLKDKLAKLEAKIQARNEQVRTLPRCEPQAGQRAMEAWAGRHKLTGLVEIKLEGKRLQLKRSEEAMARALELAGCYVVTSNVAPADLSAQQVHDHYVSLQKVERDFRTLKTGLLEVRPVWVRKARRTRGHVFCCMLALKLSREMERRLRAAFGTTETRADAITLPDMLVALARLCLLHYAVDRKTTVTKLPQPDARQNYPHPKQLDEKAHL